MKSTSSSDNSESKAGSIKSAIKSKFQRKRWIVFAITYLAYAGFYLTRKSFPVAKVGILADPSIDIGKGAMGLIDSFYGIAYALGQFIWGMSADKFGTRKVVLFGMMGSIIVAILMGLSSTAILFGFLFFFQGLFQGSGWAPLTKNVSYWFAIKERGRIYGIWSSNYAVGGVVGAAFAGYMAQRFTDWRFAFYAPAFGLLIVWILFLIFQKNRPNDVGLPPVEDIYGDKKPVLKTKDDKKVTETEGVGSTIRAVIRNPMILRLGLVYFFLKPVRYAILFWGPVLIHEKLGTNIAGSAGISVMFEVAGPLGVFFAGYASDKFFNTRRMPMCVISFFLLSGVLFMFNIVTKSNSMVLMGGILFVIGFLLYGPDALISSVSAVDFGTKEGASSAAGVINGMGSTGQVLGMSLPGVISAHYGWGTVFYIFSGFILLAALILLPKWNAVPPENNE